MGFAALLLLFAIGLPGDAHGQVGDPVAIGAIRPAVEGRTRLEIFVNDEGVLGVLADGSPSHLRANVGHGGAEVVGLENVATAGGRVHTVLAFDQSQSFRPSWDMAFDLAEGVVAQLPTDGRHSTQVLTFGQSLVPYEGEGDVHAQLAQARAAGAHQDYTRLRSSVHDAILLAAERLPLSERGVRQVVVFTDAGDESERTFQDDDLIEEALSHGVQLHMVVIVSGRLKGDRWAERLDRIKRIAEHTGGLSLLVDDPEAAAPLLARVSSAAQRAFWVDLAFCGVGAGPDATFTDEISLDVLDGPEVLTTSDQRTFRQSRGGAALEPCPQEAPPAEEAAPSPPFDWRPLFPYLGAGLLALLLFLLALLWRASSRERPQAASEARRSEPPPPPAPPPVEEAPPPPVEPVNLLPPLGAAAAFSSEDLLVRLPETHLALVSGTAGMPSRVRISRKSFVIGSNRDESVDLTLAHGPISGRHAQLSLYPSGNVFVEDLGSSNGTRVNAVRLKPGERVRLNPGDELRLSREVAFRLEQPSLSGGSRPVASAAPAAATPDPPAPADVAPTRPAHRPKTKTIIAPLKPPEKP